VWAYKPLLAAAYVVYLWLGVGVAGLRALAARIVVIAAIGGWRKLSDSVTSDSPRGDAEQ
jgi:hypothetical protein